MSVAVSLIVRPCRCMNRCVFTYVCGLKFVRSLSLALLCYVAVELGKWLYGWENMVGWWCVKIYDLLYLQYMMFLLSRGGYISTLAHILHCTWMNLNGNITYTHTMVKSQTIQSVRCIYIYLSIYAFKHSLEINVRMHMCMQAPYTLLLPTDLLNLLKPNQNVMLVCMGVCVCVKCSCSNMAAPKNMLNFAGKQFYKYKFIDNNMFILFKIVLLILIIPHTKHHNRTIFVLLLLFPFTHTTTRVHFNHEKSKS